MKFSKLLPLVFAVTFANQALSEENQPSRFFTGIELGFAQHTLDVSGAGANYEEESGNSFSPSVSFGYSSDENWSIVAQYTNYGEADLFDTNITVDVDGDFVPVNIAFSTETTGFSLVGQYATARNPGHWGWGAKLGLVRWDTDFNTTYSSGSFNEVDTESDSGIAIYGGFIGSYSFSEKLDFVMDVDWFVNDLDVEIIDGASTDMQYSRLSAGFKYYW